MNAFIQRNLITDVAGLKAGHATDLERRTGVTVLLPDAPASAAIDVRGAAPATRDCDVLRPEATVEQIHGLVLSGGSAFGLSAATGVQSWLRQRGIGFKLGPAAAPAIIPIVPQAILFDLLNGGDKNWERSPSYETLAHQACDNAATDFELGSVGAGTGATCADLKGGLGSASDQIDGFTIGALAAVNPVGQVTIGDSAQFWAAPFEQNGEYGGLGSPQHLAPQDLAPRLKGARAAKPYAAPGTQQLPPQNTTLAIIATDAALTKVQCQRLAVMAQTGMARAIYPVHTSFDGDVVFALSTGRRLLADRPEAAANALTRLGAIGANTLARAIARGIYEARAWPGGSHEDAIAPLPTWRDRFSQQP